MSQMFSSFLPGEPQGGRGSMIGVINGQELGVATLNASVQQEARSGATTFRSSIDHIPASVGEWGPAHPCWSQEEAKLGSEAALGPVPRGSQTPLRAEPKPPRTPK